MRILHIDIETYSSVDLAKSGVYKYAQSTDFEIELCAFSYDSGPVQQVSLMEGESLSDAFLKDLIDPKVVKVAHNAQFERVCLGAYLSMTLDPSQWRCTMVMAFELGLPGSLAKLGQTLGLKEDCLKTQIDSGLMRFFSQPNSKTKIANGIRNYPADDPDKWALYKAYNKQDVVAEQTIYQILSKKYIHPNEWDIYGLDQRINDQGILLDMDMIIKCINAGDIQNKRLKAEATELTGGINVRSVPQITKWLKENGCPPFENTRKEEVARLLALELPPLVRRVLELKKELGKASVKKYDALNRGCGTGRRIRGVLQFYGARTGRWAGRLFQPQNLPRNDFDDIDDARKLVKAEDWELIDMLYSSRNSVLATLIRTALVAPEGKVFAVADYSAIEARVIAWLCDETWRQKVFAEGGDIYCASASAMFHVPVEKHGQNAHLRKKGKVAELALGYGGGPGAMTTMGAKDMGLSDAEIKEIIQKWRMASPSICQFWYRLGEAVIDVVRGHKVVTLDHGLKIMREKRLLQIKLPSGRYLSYLDPTISTEKKGSIEYTEPGTKSTKNTRVTAWGGKFTENVVQAIARDCLAFAMLDLEKEGYLPVLHVHDEVVIEVDQDHARSHLDRINAIMARDIPWAPGLLLTAEGFITEYYRKD